MERLTVRAGPATRCSGRTGSRPPIAPTRRRASVTRQLGLYSRRTARKPSISSLGGRVRSSYTVSIGASCQVDRVNEVVGEPAGERVGTGTGRAPSRVGTGTGTGTGRAP